MKLFSRERLRQLAMVGGVETFGVILGGIAGLLIVNVLPKEHYAAYTFLIACTTLMMGITDLGLAHCCLPVVGQRNRDVPWVVAACHHVFHKRWVLLSAGLVIIVPYWYVTSREHGWTGSGYWVASALVLGVVLVQLREHYSNTVLLILAQISTLNRIAFASHGVRIALVGAVLLMPMTAYSTAGLLVATAGASLVALMLYGRAFRAQGIGTYRLDAADAKRVDGEVIRIAKPLVLPAIFYQVQGVVTVFIVSLFGTSNMVAEVGAFGRLAMALVVVDRVANVLLFPAIARATAGPRFVRVLSQIHGLYLLAMACTFLTSVLFQQQDPVLREQDRREEGTGHRQQVMACTFLTSVLFPQYWILLLGEQYRSLTPLVWMMFLSSLLSNAAGFAFRTLTVRGATGRQSFSIVATLVTQVLYLWLIGISDLKSVLGFGVASSAASFVFQYSLLLAHWREWRTEATHP